MIRLPPDGRQEHGSKIEGAAYALDTLVTEYLNMLSLTDKAKGEQKVRDTLAAYPVLVRVLALPVPNGVEPPQDRKGSKTQ